MRQRAKIFSLCLKILMFKTKNLNFKLTYFIITLREFSIRTTRCSHLIKYNIAHFLTTSCRKPYYIK